MIYTQENGENQMLEQNGSSTRHGGIGGAEVFLDSLAASTLDEGESSVSCPCRFTAEKKTSLAHIKQEAGWAPKSVCML